MAENLAVDLGKRASDSSAIAMQWGVQRGRGEWKEENEGSRDDRRARKQKIILEYLCYLRYVWFNFPDIGTALKLLLFLFRADQSSTFIHLFI